MAEVGMPRLSDSMRRGAVSRWLIADGTEVTSGQELLEVETDKATMTYEAEDSGVLRILVPEGQDVAVGHVIATIGAVPAEVRAPDADPVDAPARDGRVAVSPLLRRMAKDLDVDLTSVQGTGTGGRIRREDILAASTAVLAEQVLPSANPAPSVPAPSVPEPSVPEPSVPEPSVPEPSVPAASTPARSAPATPTPPPAAAPATAPSGERRALTRTQRLIAERMLESKHTAPDFALQMTVDVTRLRQLRDEMRAGQRDPGARHPTVNDFVVKACALALVAHPLLGGRLEGEVIVLPDDIGIGIAVALDGALLVPVIRHAQHRSLVEIAADTAELVNQARAGTIDATSMQGGTFTVSNLGAFGIRSFTPIINSGQAAILGVGAAIDTCVPLDGRVVVRSLLELTLTCDHRIVYGADGARFLQTVRDLLQNPLPLLLDRDPGFTTGRD